MAIEIVVGQVGSGKSYYATWRIWQEIKKIYNAEVKGEDYKYKRIWTNIEGFKPNRYVKHLKVEELIALWEEELKLYEEWERAKKKVNIADIDFSDKTIKRDVEKEKEKELVKRIPAFLDPIKYFKTKNEEILDFISLGAEEEKAYIEFVKPKFEEAEFADALIVIDEAHNFFKTLSKAKKRLVSYHRHYDQDFIFIVQDLKQLHRDVTNIAQKTIKATNPILKAGKTFQYKVYAGGYISYKDTNLLERIKLRADKDIFRLYNSGSVKQQKSHFYKLVFKLTLPLILVIVGFIYYSNYFFSHPPGMQQQTHKPKIHSSTPNKSTKAHKREEHYYILNVKKIKNLYIYKNKKYMWLDFKKALNKCKAQYIKATVNLDSTVTEYYKLKDKSCLEQALLSVSSF